MKELKNRFAEHVSIKSRREDRRITQRTIVEETGISQPTVGRYLRNEVERTEMTVIARFCIWLGIHPSEFFTWVDVDKSKATDEEKPDESARMLVPA